MRAIIQRVSEAKVIVEGEIVGQIGQGLLVYVGIAKEDGDTDLRYLRDKIAGLRIFNDEAGKMNLSVTDMKGGILAISAFALQADARKGRRPSFDAAAPPDTARQLYEQFCDALTESGLAVEKGVFQAHMDVQSVNDGPICILLDSKRLF
jgi:D-tyrosyl-tRNA(Tyr) deacylase